MTDDKQTITIQLELEVPADDYDYRVDIDGRIEYWSELVLGEELYGVTAVTTAGPSGSGWVSTLNSTESRNPMTQAVTAKPQDQMTDEQRIDNIVTAIREKYPTVVRFGVSSSDQGGGGYNLIDVTFPDGSIVDADSGEFAQLADDLWEDAIWLRWGAFGDKNDDSSFDVDLTTRKIVHLERCPDCGYTKGHTVRCVRN